MADRQAAREGLRRQIANLTSTVQQARNVFEPGSGLSARLDAWLPGVIRSLNGLGLAAEAKELVAIREKLRFRVGSTYVNDAEAILDFVREVEAGLREDTLIPQVTPESSPARFPIQDGLRQVLWICKRFPVFAGQLRKRQRGRRGLNLRDEYDLQDALHALLRMHSDVRPEEFTPSHAGAASRMDFLLPAEKLVVETKFVRPDLLDSKLGDELIADIARYGSHPSCEHLVCFVYDPARLLKNAPGIQHDLTRSHGKPSVWVAVEP